MLFLTRYFFRLTPLLFIATGSLAQNISSSLDYGLQFASHEVTTDQRSSLNLTPEQSMEFDKGLELQFDFSLRRLTNAYGYILRIIANDSVNIDLMSSPDHIDFHDLGVIINNQQTQLQYEFADVSLTPQQWTTVVIGFSVEKNEISITWEGNKKTHSYPVKGLHTFRFFFGANDFPKFNTSDVPAMSIRNIEIRTDKHLVAQWELKKHHGDKVYDNLQQRMALTKNPQWLIDRHTKWVHQKSFIISKYPSIAFKSTTGILYAVDVNGINILDIRSKNIRHHPYTSGNVVFTDANQLIYVEEKNKLLNYDISSNVLSTYDSTHHSWSNTGSIYHEPNYWHNNKFYNQADSSLYTFGGYGFFTYKNTFFRYNDLQGNWEKVNVKGTIPPRYLSASGMTAAKDRVLIFGGYGSVSGKQELSPQSFYDLYSYDLQRQEVKKIWEASADDYPEDLVFSNSMVINEEDSCFYVLGFPKNKYENAIKLRRYGLNTPASTIVADSIPFLFHDENSFCDLFLSRITKELIAVTVHKEKDKFKVDVYSINYPPMRAEDVWQTPRTAGVTLYQIAAFSGAIIIVLLIVWMRKKFVLPAVAPTPVKDPVYSDVQNHVAEGEVLKHIHEEKPVSTINLFGGFQVLDRQGHDITGKFTMTLKELFLLILLHSIKYEKGISTTELQEYLWSDKDDVSARNNRNVNIKKLRTLLDEISDITIENNNTYLHLVLPTEVFCDYQVVFRILNSEEVSMDHHAMEILLKYVKRGSLLPNVTMVWLDNFKSDISNKIIDMLVEFSSRLDFNKDDKILLEIADAIFRYDTINQEALVIKCSVLNKKGKYSLAKTWYDHFAKEYKNLYAENYPKTFDEVIS